VRLSDIQPQYFPRLHYFARMLDSDVFVLRDEVQFVRNHRYPDGGRGVSYQAHTPIKTPDGAHLLAISVKKGSGLPINETAVSYDQPWTRKHANVIKSFYGRAPSFASLMPELEALFERRYDTVAELDVATTLWALGRALGCALAPEELSIERINDLLAATRPGRLRRIELGSRVLHNGVHTSASERIALLCQLAGADEYMAGGTAVQAYLDTSLFRRSSIELVVQDWTCPVYPQQFTARAGHLANLSILDLLMNAPAGEAASLLMSTQTRA
jgi:hypothetical protein